MRLTFLGTGTSIGVPSIGCQCEVCLSDNPKDKRLRASAILETDEGLRVLIDCGPDFREQIMRYHTPMQGSQKRFFSNFDAVVITHIHYDHVGGIDDLRPFTWFGDLDVYAQMDVVEGLHKTMPYCFKEHLYPGVPHLKLHEVQSGRAFRISRPHDINLNLPGCGADLEGHMHSEVSTIHIPAVNTFLEIMPISVLHGKLPILGYRFGKLAYITDMKYPSEDTLKLLDGVETLVINALRFEKEHHSHQLVRDAVNFSHLVGAKETYLTHLTHDIGTHEIAGSHLPEGFHFAYDGMVIEA